MMKKLLVGICIIANIGIAAGQTLGISYQAVIIDQNAQEIAGVDAEGNIMPFRDILVRFTILDAAGTVDYQEEQATSTDAYGLINLVIGQGTPTSSSLKLFQDIDWNGSPKQLKVDLSLSQTDMFYTDFSLQDLNFIPYAYHKNITATGTLKVDQKSTLQDLSVEATTNLNGSLDVNNFSPTHLSGDLSVDKKTKISDTLTVNSASNLNGRVVITSIDSSGNDDQVSSYPLYVKGSKQGIAIAINGTRSNSNNFITFLDAEGAQGRIEGETKAEIKYDPEFIYQNLVLAHNLASAITEVTAAATSSTPCVGLAPCFTTPSWWEIMLEVAQLGIASADVVLYNTYRMTNAGVTYQSGGADYAEFLPKTNIQEIFYPGDIVGVRGGFVSHVTASADKIMVVSGKPVVVGNMPQETDETNYVKVAFLGQVDSKVLGVVNTGDYIIPSGKNDGFGTAVSPDKITAEEFIKVAGVAWNNTETNSNGYINVVVGLHTYDVARLSIKYEKKISELETEVQRLKDQVELMNKALAETVPGYAGKMGENTITSTKPINKEQSLESDISVNTGMKTTTTISSASDTLMGTDDEGVTYYYYKISREQVAEGLQLARDILEKQGNLTNNPLFTKLEEDAAFKEIYIDEMLNFINNKRDENYNLLMKSGAKVVK